MLKKGCRFLLSMFLVMSLVSVPNANVFSEEIIRAEQGTNPQVDQQDEVEDSFSNYQQNSVQTEQEKTDESGEAEEMIIEEVVIGEAYDVKMFSVSNEAYDYIVLKVWNEKNKEEDATLHIAKWEDDKDNLKENEDPHYVVHLFFKGHENAGVYQVVAYGLNNIGSNRIKTEDDITLDMISDKELAFQIEKTSFIVPDSAEEKGKEAKDSDESEESQKETLSTDIQEENAQNSIASEAPKLMLKAAASSSSLRGIDVSKHNGSIDWAKVKASGIKYAIIRCGYGDNIVSQDDTRWAYNVAECERLGIPYGVYIYSYATSLSHAQSEADHCIRLLKGHHPSYPVFLDLEDSCMNNLSNANLASFTQTWATKIMSAGYTPGVYSSKSWWTSRLTSSVFNNYCKWVAQWNTSCTYSGTYHAWQYSSTGSVSGISGNVDMDYWYGYSSFVINYGTVSGSGPEFGLYEIKSSLDENYVLDIANASQESKANLQLYRRNGTGAQKFWVIPLGYDNQYYIMNRTSGKYLDVDNNYTDDRTNIRQYSGNGTSAQRYRIISVGSGVYEIQGVGSDKFVDVDQAVVANQSNIQIYKSNHTAAQRWKLVLTTDIMPDSLPYEIVSSVNPNYTMDIELGSKENKANVQLYKRNKTLAQRFAFVPLGYDDLYYIVNKGSGKNLDVFNNGKESRTNVWQYNFNGTEAQVFKLIPLEGGKFEICGLGSGKFLDVDNAKDTNGTNIQIYNGNHTAAQRWYFMRLD